MSHAARPTSFGQEAVAPVEAAETRVFAIAAARIAAEQKTDHVAVLDLRGLSNLADYFVLGTGTSSRQMRAVLDHLREYARSIGRQHLHIDDSRDSTWLLADYVDVVVHLFDEQHRSYYDLDGLWGDAPQVEWRAGESGRGD